MNYRKASVVFFGVLVAGAVVPLSAGGSPDDAVAAAGREVGVARLTASLCGRFEIDCGGMLTGNGLEVGSPSGIDVAEAVKAIYERVNEFGVDCNLFESKAEKYLGLLGMISDSTYYGLVVRSIFIEFLVVESIRAMETCPAINGGAVQLALEGVFYSWRVLLLVLRHRLVISNACRRLMRLSAWASLTGCGPVWRRLVRHGKKQNQ